MNPTPTSCFSGLCDIIIVSRDYGGNSVSVLVTKAETFVSQLQ